MLWFILAYAISSFAAVLPAQHSIRIFELGLYKRPPFFEKLRENPALRHSLIRRWLICLGIQVLLLAGILYAAFFLLDFPYGYVYRAALLMLAIVFFAAMALLYRKWRKQGADTRPERLEQALRLDIWLFLIVMVLHVIVLVLLAMLLSLASQWIPDFNNQTVGNYTAAYIVYNIVVLLAPYFSVMLSQFLTVMLLPRLISLAAILSRAARTVQAEKKD